MTSRNNRPIIEVKHLSKEYRIGMDRTYKRFSESITNAVCHPLRTLRETTQPKDTFWALRDVNFEVERGEVLGIIGRNGAGKSTLLKVLSRITYPTEGEIVMRGRVGSLLEVGTGFHPELTGRENIYFNGAILGMKKKEIDDKFDEIVKFSGVEKFLDTPVKRYSSGMQVRLAFSVAAHLDPEILLVDEVLAVGDAEFQKKCLGKMGEVASEGRTVLFVSHNMDAVRRLCNRVLVVEEGELCFDSDGEKAFEAYQKIISNRRGQIRSQLNEKKDSSKKIKITSVEVFSNNSANRNVFSMSDCINIRIEYDVRDLVKNATIACVIANTSGDFIIDTHDTDLTPDLFENRIPGRYVGKLKIPHDLLNVGTYEILVFAGIPLQSVIFDDLRSIYFSINQGENSNVYRHSPFRKSVLGLEVPWEIDYDKCNS